MVKHKIIFWTVVIAIMSILAQFIVVQRADDVSVFSFKPAPSLPVVLIEGRYNLPANKLVEQTKAPVNSHAGTWVLKLASFQSKESAKKMLKLLQEKGYRAFMLPAVADFKLFYRIYVGPYNNVSKVKQDSKAVNEQFLLDSNLLQYSVEEY